jgi:hypothetical protein
MPKRSKQVKTNFHSVDTSRAKKQSVYKKPNNLQVEKDINKNKEVKEKDVFDFTKGK